MQLLPACLRVYAPDPPADPLADPLADPPADPAHSGRSFYHKKDGYTALSASATLIDGDVVVTSASVISPFLEHLGENGAPSRTVKGAIFEVLLEDDQDTWLPAELLAIVEATGVRDAISRLTERDTDCWECGWAVGSPLPHADLSTFAQFSIANVAVCGIAVLKMRKTKGQLVDGFIGAGVKRVSTEFASEPKVGRPLLLYSSPFGLVTPLVLSNMVSRGIVSNIVAVVREPHGIDKTSVALMVTDVRVLPGMEGASCFYYDGANGGEFAGMAMVPIRRKDGDPVDLALIIPARTILSAVEPFLSFSSSLSPSPSAVRIAATDRDAALARTRSAVVLIAVNNTWASGVIVSEDGYILTSAHIFYEFLEEESPGSPRARLKDWVRVRVRIGDCWFYTGNLDFVSLTQWDVALLRLSGPGFEEERRREGGLPFVELPGEEIEFNTSPGLPLLALGHGVFGPRSDTACTMTSGVVSKVVRHRDQPVMIVSSTKVHRGCSGGVLVDAAQPERVIGLISSNARTQDGVTITEVNFAIPTNQLAPIAEFLRTRDRNTLLPLEVLDTEIEDIWFLRTAPPQFPRKEGAKILRSKL